MKQIWHDIKHNDHFVSDAQHDLLWKMAHGRQLNSYSSYGVVYGVGFWLNIAGRKESVNKNTANSLIKRGIIYFAGRTNGVSDWRLA